MHSRVQHSIVSIVELPFIFGEMTERLDEDADTEEKLGELLSVRFCLCVHVAEREECDCVHHGGWNGVLEEELDLICLRRLHEEERRTMMQHNE